MAITAAIGAVVAAGASVAGAVGASKSRKLQRRRQEVMATRERAKQFGEARIAKGSIRQAGVNTGSGLDSSGVVAGSSGVVQQARSNVAFINQIDQINARIAAAEGLVQTAGAIGQIGSAATSTAVAVKQLQALNSSPDTSVGPTR